MILRTTNYPMVFSKSPVYIWPGRQILGFPSAMSLVTSTKINSLWNVARIVFRYKLT